MPTFPGVISQACTSAQIDSARFAWLCAELRRQHLCHRKKWEWCYILQALYEHGAIGEGRRGLGFGVGTEPLTAYLAAHGCHITATDLPTTDHHHESWASTGQHADSLEEINRDGLCDPAVLRERVTFQPVDMNAVPADLTGFDFTWSSCALEHLGDLDAGIAFVERSMRCLSPGGVAVHTTEYNVSSDDDTVETGDTVAYRRRDLRRLARALRSAGHEIELTFGLGSGPADRHIDVVPFTNTHLKVALEGHVITSFGIIVRAGPPPHGLRVDPAASLR